MPKDPSNENARYRTCDLCRKRKARCVPVPIADGASSSSGEDQTCTTCAKSKSTCTFLNGYKRPGRPKLSLDPTQAGRRSSQSQAVSDHDGPSEPRPNVSPRSSFTSSTQLPPLAYGEVTPAIIPALLSGGADSRVASNPFEVPGDIMSDGRGKARQAGVRADVSGEGDGYRAQPLNSASEAGGGKFNDAEGSSVMSRLPHAQELASSSSRTLPSIRSPTDSLPLPSWSPFPLLSSFDGDVSIPAPHPNPPAATANQSGEFEIGRTPDMWVPSDKATGQTASSGHEPMIIAGLASLNGMSVTDGEGPRSSDSKSYRHDHHELASQIPTYERISISSHMTIDDVAPWVTIGNILTIFLRYMHALFPLVHKPTFTLQLATRADRQDRNLAAMILGIVSYTIGQCPLGRLTPIYSRHELQWLQKRCHLASLALLDRQYRTITVSHIGTLMAGYFYCQSVGLKNPAAALLAEACQMVHTLCMNGTDDGVDWVERELRRRTFWHVYAVDATEACAGHIIHLHAFEGFTPFPLATDDEFITTQGVFPQPTSTLSYFAGFVACVRVFPLIADCVRRQRQLKWRNRENRPCTVEEVQAERNWIADVKKEITEQMMSLPAPLYRAVPSPDVDDSDPAMRAIIGMQRANMIITEVLLRIVLHEYQAELEPESQGLDEEVHTIDRAFKTLSALDLDDLAANGESMLCKINQIFLHLLLRAENMTTSWAEELQRWWMLYSSVQSAQLIHTMVDSHFPSRRHSPALA
ncbi:hypothetical protein IAU59_004026 [Kwoniella sp. CBS 9459]